MDEDAFTVNAEFVARHRARAEKGDLESQYMLAFSHYKGTGSEQDEELAFKWFEVAASSGHAESQYMLASLYHDGRGINRDYKQSFVWLKKAAEQDHLEAQSLLAQSYHDGMGTGVDYGQAFQWWQKAAEQGHAESQYRLAICYYLGRGVARDEELAHEWWVKAAAQRHGGAQYYLDNPLQDADANGQDEEHVVAVEKQGESAEESDFVTLKLNVWEGDADDDEAELASVPHYEEDVIVYVGDSFVIPEVEDEAIEQEESEEIAQPIDFHQLGRRLSKRERFLLYKSAAEQGDPEAQHMLATCYYKGIGTPKDKVEAIRWWERGVLAGHTESMYQLARHYNHNINDRNRGKAFALFMMAADQGHVGALEQLSLCYYAGWGTNRDVDAAFRLAMQAVELGNTDAIRRVAGYHRYGAGTEENADLAKEWNKRAIRATPTLWKKILWRLIPP